MAFSREWNALLRFWEKETKRHILIRYLLLVSIITSYAVFISFKFGVGNGFLITMLTWSFFVLCTPVADAGFILDLPVRLITGMKMIYSEMMVWIFAIALNVYASYFSSGIYDKTIMLKLFHYILSGPYPYRGIILLSGAGTFLSIYFGDELMDVSSHVLRENYHKHLAKHQVIIFIFIIILILILYDFMLKNLGITISL